MPQYVSIYAGQGPSDKTAHPSSKPSAHAPLTNDAKSSPLESHILQSHDNLPGDDSLNITPIAFAKESSVQRESPGSRNRGWRAMDTRATALPPQMPESLAKPVLNPTQTPSLKPITDFPSSSNTVKSNHQNHGPVAQYSKHGENQRDRSVLDDSSKRTTMHHARQMPPVQNSKLSATPLANPVPLSGSQIIPIHAKLASQSETHNMLEYDSTPRSNSSIPPLVHDDRAPNLNVSPTLDRAQNKSHPDQFPLSGSPRQPALPSVPNLVASYEVRTKTSGQPAGVVPGAVASPLIATRSGPGVYNEPREDWHSPRPRRLHRVDSNPPPPFIPRPPTAMDLNHGPHGSARFESNAAIPHTANMSGPAIPSVSIPRDKNFDNPVTNSNQWLSGPTARVADLPVAPVNNNVGMTIPRPSTAMDRRNDSSSKVPVQYPPHRATPATPTVINRDFEFPLKRPSTATGFRYEVGRDKGLPGPLIPSSLAENTNSNHHFNPPLIRPSISQPNERMSTHSPIISTQASKLHDILSDKPSPSRLAGNSVLSPIRAGANSFVDPHTLSNPDIQMTRTSSAQRPIDTSVNDAGNIPSRVLRQVSNQPERDGGHQSGNPSQALEKASESNPPEEPRGRVRSTPPSAIAPATPITKYSPYIMPSPADIHSPPFGTTLKGRQAPTTSPIHPSENNVFRPVIQHPQLLELLSSPTRIEHKTSQPYNLKPANTTHIPTMATPPNNKRPEDTSQDHPAAIGKLVNPSHALHTPPTPTPLAPPTAPQARHSPTLPTPPISNTMKDSQTHALSYYSPMYKAPDNSTAPTRGAPSYVPQTPNPTTQLLSKSREPSDPRIYRPVRPRETPANPGSQPLSSIDRAEPSTPHPQRSLSVDPSAPSADRRVYIQDAQDGGLLQGARSKGYNMHAPAMQTSSTLPPARYRTWQPEQRTHRPEPRAREGNTSASELPGSSAGRAAQLNGHTSSRNAHASTPAVTPLKALPPSQPLSKRPPPDNLVIASTRVPAPAPRIHPEQLWTWLG
ncbi:hypothetical protein BD779DRAFT_845225 [Infundibulicybe gibba]|nr:hypothetical protein BD779DRAFT_845225 [Infundibulicybe gibba]